MEAFGNGLLSNLVVVVTHWSMSESANETRESDGISRESMLIPSDTPLSFLLLLFYSPLLINFYL